MALAVDGGGPVTVDADASAVVRVLRNLLDNAIRHSPEGGTVRVEVAGTPAGAVLRVADEGPGFPEELRARAFTRFVRGDTARARGAGAGLGLSIARGLVEASGGEIGLEDGPGGRVVVRLPPRAPPAAVR